MARSTAVFLLALMTFVALIDQPVARQDDKAAATTAPAGAATASEPAGGATTKPPGAADTTGMTTPGAPAGAGTAGEKDAIVKASNAFCVDFFQMMNAKAGNLVMSPFNAMATLSMILQGTGGKTAQELQTALHLPANPTAVVKGFKALLGGLETTGPVVLRIANKMFTHRGAKIKAPFNKTIIENFNSQWEEIDFQAKTSLDTINNWVQKTTDNKIIGLFSNIDPSTLILVVNAVFYKGNWEKIFDKTKTRVGDFQSSKTAKVRVLMMQMTNKFRYAALPNLDASVLELPYQGLTIKMYVILPNTVDGLPKVEKGLDLPALNDLTKKMADATVSVTLPRFKIQNTFALEKDLPKLKINDLFTPKANMSGITEEGIFLTNFVQKAFVEVTEQGTTAATAKAAQDVKVDKKEKPVIFKVAHPFLFLLMAPDNIVLFVGRVQNPMI